MPRGTGGAPLPPAKLNAMQPPPTDPNQNVAQAGLANSPWLDNPFTRAGAWLLDNSGNALNRLWNPNADVNAPGDAVAAPGQSALDPKQVQQLHQMGSAQGMDPAVIDTMIAGYGNAPGGYQKIMDQVLQQQTQNLRNSALDSGYQPAIAGASAQATRLHGIATDPSKALTDSEFGARYSTGKAALDSLVNTGRMNSREAEASHTGGALTGRGLALSTGYDIAAQQGKGQLSSGLMGEAGQRGDTWQQYGDQLSTNLANAKQGVLSSYTPQPGDLYDTGVGVRGAAAGRSAQATGAGLNAFTGTLNTLSNGATGLFDRGATVLGGIAGPKAGQMFRGKGGAAGLPAATLG